MNQTIENYFDLVETALIESAVIQSFRVLRREVSLSDGKLRLKAQLVDDSLIEMFAYVIEQEQQASVQKYSFHWQAQNGDLICRWDNAPHYLHLRSAPHHRHNADGTVSEVYGVSDFLMVLKIIQDTILI
jgi:hypothetical protein